MSLESATIMDVRPPQGMSCTRCIAAGHSCAASAYDAGVAVCHYCLDDVPCPMAKRNPPLSAGLDDGVPLRQPQPRRHFGNMTMPDPMCTRGCGARRHRGACKGKTYSPAFPPKVQAESNSLTLASTERVKEQVAELRAGAPPELAQPVPATKPAKPVTPNLTIDPQNAGRHARTITLASGGYITLSVTLDWFALSVAERKFVFDLVDALDAYQGGAQ